MELRGIYRPDMLCDVIWDIAGRCSQSPELPILGVALQTERADIRAAVAELLGLREFPDADLLRVLDEKQRRTG